MFGIGECVFNCGADCIYECHQGFELGVEAQENEENVINESNRLGSGTLGSFTNPTSLPGLVQPVNYNSTPRPSTL